MYCFDRLVWELNGLWHITAEHLVRINRDVGLCFDQDFILKFEYAHYELYIFLMKI